MRAFLYYRTESGKSAIDEWLCTATAPIEVVGRFNDAPIAHRNGLPARKALGAAIMALPANTPTTWVVVARLSEISGSLKHLKELVRIASTHGVLLFSTMENLVVGGNASGMGDILDSQQNTISLIKCREPPLIIDTRTLQTLSKFEAEARSFRTKELAANASANGGFWGRPPKISKLAVKDMLRAGLAPVKIADRLRVSPSTIYRVMAESSEAQNKD